MATEALELIAAQRDEWVSAINAGDAGRFAALVTEDAVWLPAMVEGVQGRQGIQEWVQGPFSIYDYTYFVSDVRVRLAGNWAVERAKFVTEARLRAGGDAPTHKGEYTIVWRFAAGKWLIERYIDQTES